MKVFLVRHAIAHERNRVRWPNDALRPLTSAGVQKFRRAAGGLSRWMPRSARLLTSPFVRARETAVLLAEARGSKKPVDCTELAADKPFSQAFELLRSQKGEKAVVLVGHEPYLSGFLSLALAGQGTRLEIDFKKGGAALIEFTSRIEPGRACLLWIMPPRVLRALR
jgi:phosphohistidine phosphatase